MKHQLSFASAAAVFALGTTIVLTGAMKPAPAAQPAADVALSYSRIYWEYNASANDLGVHVTLDGEDWRGLKIRRPDNKLLFHVKGGGPYKLLGMTELFFEGAEPSLDDYPLEELLAKFPEGRYDFKGSTVDGEDIVGAWMFSHAIPDGPQVFAAVGVGDYLQISWNPVTDPPLGFPSRPIVITGYQVIVGSFQVTLPPTATSVTVPPEFVASLAAGEQPFEVLAIEQSGNQTLTEGTFIK